MPLEQSAKSLVGYIVDWTLRSSPSLAVCFSLKQSLYKYNVRTREVFHLNFRYIGQHAILWFRLVGYTLPHYLNNHNKSNNHQTYLPYSTLKLPTWLNKCWLARKSSTNESKKIESPVDQIARAASQANPDNVAYEQQSCKPELRRLGWVRVRSYMTSMKLVIKK